MAVSDLINKINSLAGRRVVYMPYDLSKVSVFIGAPPLPILGVAYVSAVHSHPQTRRVMSLTGDGGFVSNFNQSGMIEMGLSSNTVSTGILEVLNLLGAPFPIAIIDRTTNGSSQVIARKCRRVGTPEWRRALAPDVEIFTFATTQLTRTEGVREQDGQ